MVRVSAMKPLVAFTALTALGCASSPPPVDAPVDARPAVDASRADASVPRDAPRDDSAAPDVALTPDVATDAATDVAPTAITCAPGPSRSPIPAEITQALLVTTPSWTSAHGSLGRFERRPGGPWTLVGSRVATSIGRAGLAWGRGLHGQGAPADCEGPTKVEGDGRSPAGVFALGAVYGDTAGAGSFSYRVLTPSWRCPDDPASRFYNQVLDASSVTPDWNSAEQMVRADGLYRWVVFVEHNTAPRVARGGSCIFVHVWGGAASTTSGCTSLERAALEEALAWLHPERAVEVALPGPVYAAVRESWGLP